MRKHTWLSLLLTGLVAMGAAASTERKSCILSDFENQADLARIGLRGIPKDSFTLTDEGRTHGNGAARLMLAKWKPGADAWPALILPMNNGLPADWTSYDCLAMDVRNDSTAAVDLAFYVGDRSSESVGHHFIVPAGRLQTLRFRFHDSEFVNFAQVREMHLYATRPSEVISLVVDNLRLEEALDSRLDVARRKLDKLKTEGIPSELTPLYSDVQNSLQGLQSKLDQAPSADDRQALRPQVLSVEERIRLQLPRAISESKLRAGSRKFAPNAPYACGWATGMEKIFPRDVPFRASASREQSLELAGNEQEATQLLILAGAQGLKGVRVDVSPLRRLDGTSVARIPSAQASPMGFVNTPKPPYRSRYVGWYPDPILSFLSQVDIKPGELQPIWIDVRAPADTPAGEYASDITVQPADAPPVKLTLRVKVWGFNLPSETHLRTAVSFRDPSLEQVYGSLSESMRLRYYDFLLEHRINPDNIYRFDPPKITDLQRWSRRGMNAFNITYVVKPKDLKPNAPYPEEEKKKILATLDAIVPQLKEKGLYDKAYVYGFDEIWSDSFNAAKDIFSAIKAKYPDLPLLTTAFDGSFGQNSGLSMVDGWVPLTRAYDPTNAAKARARGKQVWWYTCIVPKEPYANWLIEYDAIDARSLMGLQTAKYQPDGYLYYAVNRWPLSKKPITEGPYTDWPTQSFADFNGDGSFMCAGPDGPLSTIRMENIRDGIEDNEYFWLLRQEVPKLKASSRPDAITALRKAEVALVVGDDLVKSLSEFNKSPEALYAKRRQLADAILEARKVLAQ